MTPENKPSKKLIEEAKKLANIVGSTLGAEGKLVVYKDKHGRTIANKDGVSVAQHTEVGPGGELLKQAALFTVRNAGDGTTTSTVIAAELLGEYNRAQQEGLELALEDVTEYIDKTSIPVTNVEAVATIACNNDPINGKLIADAWKDAGKYGNVALDISNSKETYTKLEHGLKLDNGFMDVSFANDQQRNIYSVENPYLFFSTSTIDDPKELMPIIKIAMEEQRPLVIVAAVKPEAAAAFAVNARKGFPVCLISPNREEIEDIAIVTGAKLHGPHLGDDKNLLNKSFLGTCDSAYVDRRESAFRFDVKPQNEDRIAFLKSEIKQANNELVRDQLKRRLANVAGTLGMIYVGGETDIEVAEKQHRMEDAVYATELAIKEGIVPGGGVALKDAAQALRSHKHTGDVKVGYDALLKAIVAPYERILTNAEMKAKVLGEGMGINALTGEEINMIESDIIDPSSVTKAALVSAVSAAKIISNVSHVLI